MSSRDPFLEKRALKASVDHLGSFFALQLDVDGNAIEESAKSVSWSPLVNSENQHLCEIVDLASAPQGVRQWSSAWDQIDTLKGSSLEPYVYSARLIKLNEGAFYNLRPHPSGSDLSLKLIMFLANCDISHFGFLIEGERRFPERHRFYLLNTDKKARALSFANESVLLELELRLDVETVSYVCSRTHSR